MNPGENIEAGTVDQEHGQAGEDGNGQSGPDFTGFGFQDLINSVEAIIWEADFKSSAITYVSNYVVELLGYPLDKWLQDPDLFASIVHPDDLQLIARAKGSVTALNNRYQVTYRVVKSSGEIVWLSDRVQVVFEASEPKLLRGISTDVSERRRVEEALALVVEVTLAASELESVPDIAQVSLSRICELLDLCFGQVWFLDKGASFLKASPPVYFATLNMDAEFEINGLRQESLEHLFDPQIAEGLPGLAAVSGGAVFSDDLSCEPRRRLAHSKELRSGFAFPVRNGDELVCVFEVFSRHLIVPDKFLLNAIDEIAAHLSVVFERRIAQELLTIQREHEEAILDAMPVMVWFKDTNGRILRVNKAGAAIRGMEPWEMTGKTDWELYPDEADYYYADDLEVISSGKPKLGIVEQHLLGDGSKTWVSTDKIPYLDQFGNIKGVIVFASDISKLKNAEEELLAIREDLENKVAERTKELDEANIYFALSRDLLCIAGKDGYFRRLNTAWEEKLGYTLSELLERPYTSFIHPDDLDKTLALAQHLNKGGYIRNFENRYVRKDGSICWLLWSASASRDGDAIYSVAYDITDRKAAEFELYDMSMALKNAVEGIAKVDPESRYLSVNESYAALHGLSSEEFVGRSVIDFIAPEDQSTWFDCYGEMLRKGKAEVELSGRKESGQCFHEQITLVKVEGQYRHFQGYYIFDKDITARMATENSLRQSEARFHNLASHMPGGIYQYLRRPDGSFYFPYVSPGCGAILGISPEEIMASPELLFTLLNPEDVPKLDEALEESSRLMKTFIFEGRIDTPAGERWIHAESTPEFHENGDVIFNGLVTDITEKRYADEKIRKLNEDLSERVEKLAAVNKELESLTRKLELAYDAAMEASKVKSEFVANISHEIRTPISAVIGMSELLLDTNLSDEQRQFSSMVKDSAQSLLTIINDILDFSKMEAGHLELEVTEINLLNLVEDSAELLAPSARKKGLSLVTYVAPELPETVLGDAVRIRQILLNLTSNAVKFTNNGEVSICVDNSPAYPDMVRFTISDTGIGLSPTAKYRLFNPFFQADGSTTRNYGGTGLGLSICKLLVELMGGRIDFSSEENKGASFWFDLPLPICAGARSVDDAVKAYLTTADLASPFSVVTGRGRNGISKKDSPYSVLLASASAATLTHMPAYLQSSRWPLKVCTLKLGGGLGGDDRPSSMAANFEPLRALLLDVSSFPVSTGEDSGSGGIESGVKDPLLGPVQLALKALSEALASESERHLQFEQGVRIMVLTPVEVQGVLGALEEQLLTHARRHFRQYQVDGSSTQDMQIKLMFLVKPSRFVDLMDAFERLLSGQLSRDPGTVPSLENLSDGGILRKSSSRLPVLKTTLPVAEVSPYRVLVAEDNPVMQELALRQLERLGYVAEVVKNGKQAVEAVRSRQYAMVLMDCQMPEMDGYEATTVIRREEGGAHHVPIIAMTASAMKGDRENCLASGMDDYLSKPVSQSDLMRVLNRWVLHVSEVEAAPAAPSSRQARELTKNSAEPSEAAEPAQSETSADRNTNSTVDVNELVTLYGGDDLPRLIESFLQECDSLISDISIAYENGRVDELIRLAHQLKGLAVVMTAVPLSDTALELERAARRSSGDVENLLIRLSSDFSSVRDYLYSFLSGKDL
ncbi:MAG TPA: PAS domain S-box protein [Candidatus Obscuribacter sp.]|nr:PAS domain S-box protein [Candidatus Obscuribacter sp.]